MFLALLRAHFSPRHARAKMILSRAKNIFMPANVNSIVILMKKRYVIFINIDFAEKKVKNFLTLILNKVYKCIPKH